MRLPSSNNIMKIVKKIQIFWKKKKNLGIKLVINLSKKLS